MTKSGYDQHETHCRWKPTEGTDNQWKVKATCTIEGSESSHEFTLTVSGDTLTMGEEHGSNDLLRCK